ncbi:hypothetical protein E2C01_016543 [Portunus trituberculatus]|uniref:Uncharacterized protein n=1 Tax=Portunus trituberculatus TaxID=210409 RepID=A0A5B7DR68_PORTR|nr:hypothetical protein [Portunus trituberculatus]
MVCVGVERGVGMAVLLVWRGGEGGGGGGVSEGGVAVKGWGDQVGCGGSGVVMVVVTAMRGGAYIYSRGA